MSLFKNLIHPLAVLLRWLWSISWRNLPATLSRHLHQILWLLQKEYKTQRKLASTLPPNFYMIWEGMTLLWQNKGKIISMAFLPWLTAVLLSAIFAIALPKSLLYNYGLSWFINFILISQFVYPLAFWAVGSVVKDGKFSLSTKKWSIARKEYTYKIIFWLLILAVVFYGGFFALNFFYNYAQSFIHSPGLKILTIGLTMLSYFLLIVAFFYFLSGWLFLVPFIAFKSHYALSRVRQLYDLVNVENELKKFFSLLRRHHLWIFFLFLGLLVALMTIFAGGLFLAVLVYYLTNLITFWLPLFIRSNIIQVILMNAVILTTVFTAAALNIIITCRSFWFLRYKKNALLPKVADKNIN